MGFINQNTSNIVFPMYVGVILIVVLFSPRANSIPHVCGGDPMRTHKRLIDIIVFPMYVGVIRHASAKAHKRIGIPHVCGGDPGTI